jgi:glycosyltransferase involved in cell wall biosynthesis
MLEHLAKRGYSVTLFVARSRKAYAIKNSGISTVQVPLRYVPALTSLAFTWIVALVLPYYILVKRPSYIVTDPNIAILGFLGAPALCRLSKTKLILDIRSTPVEVSGVVNRFLAFFFGVSVLFARETFDGMTVITALMKEQVCSRFRIDRSFPGVWTSGVSKTLFDPNKYIQKAQNLKKQFGLADKFIVFYHGVFSSKRGLMECIECIAKFNRRGKTGNYGVVLFLLGSGNVLPAMKEQIAKCGVDGSVIIHESVDYSEVPKYISMCDIAISALPNIPDWRYQSPLNVLEYLSMEKPVIATDIPAHRQVMRESKCVIYAPSAEPNELAKAIAYAYDKREILKVLGAYGRQIVDNHFTWDKVAENFDQYLSSL